MGKIKGITVTLYEKKQTGSDSFGDPIYTETPVSVDNVLVSPASDTEVLATNNIYGKKAIYTLGIPKGDTHEWEDSKVSFFGKMFKTFGAGQEGIEALVPLDWNRKISVMRYE